jgi:hypothetical protein
VLIVVRIPDIDLTLPSEFVGMVARGIVAGSGELGWAFVYAHPIGCCGFSTTNLLDDHIASLRVNSHEAQLS